jgi:uncharacterized protein (DUF952 family)
MELEKLFQQTANGICFATWREIFKLAMSCCLLVMVGSEAQFKSIRLEAKRDEFVAHFPHVRNELGFISE